MKPIGMLMREHRLIEKIVDLLKEEVVKITEETDINTDFLALNVDFFRTYADRTHHGKEEDILFKKLTEKTLSSEHGKMLELLTEEHKHARQIVTSLNNARDSYMRGNTSVLNDIEARLGELIVFYPDHIEKEDKHFFYPCMDYFSEKEQDAMLEEFREFDLRIIHEKYERVLAQLEREPHGKV